MIITDLLNKDIEILEMGGAYPYLSKNDKRKGISDFKKCFGCRLHCIHMGEFVI